jgi:hypothetical protein
MITTNETVSIIAGVLNSGGFDDGEYGIASFSSPSDMIADSNNNLFVNDYNTNNGQARIRRVILNATCGIYNFD